MKLRCGKFTNRKVNNMEKSEEVSVAVQIEKDTNEVATSQVDSSSTGSVASLLRGIAKEINVMKQQLNERLDKINSELCEKIDGLKLDINNSVSNFQKFLRTETLGSVDPRIIKSLGSDGSFRKPVESGTHLLGSANKADVPGVALGNSLLVKPDTAGPLPADVTLATPQKALGLPCISESPELNLKKSPPCGIAQTSVNRPILPFPSLVSTRSVPVLTVASSMPLLMSPIAQPPIKFLRTIKPKPSTSEEVIVSDFDGSTEDHVQPTSILSVDGERVMLPGSSRVRTRGGVRRGTPIISVYEKGEDIDVVPDKKASIRGGRRCTKSKQSLTIRRKSERLKKSDSDSPNKDGEQNLFSGDTPLEEFLWGDDNVVSPTNDSLKKMNDQSVQNKINESSVRNEDDREINSDMLGKLSRVDSVCDDVLSAGTNDNISSKDQGKPQTDRETNIVGLRKNRLKSEEDRNTGSSVNDNMSKETPRNIPFKKTLSLSSPRRRSHIRALDFATPIKALPPRKANTSPKAVSQVKLAQMRSLRRTNLFKSPAKKTKSWDADLRAFVEPDLSLSHSSGRKRQPNRLGRSAKFISPKKKCAIKMKGKRIKTPMKHKFIENCDVSNIQKKSPIKKSLPDNDSSPKSAEELVKEIEKEVLEVISEDSKSKCNTDELIKDMRNNTNDATESGRVNKDLNKSSSPETEPSIHRVKVNKSSQAVSATPAKILDKTPAKLDFAGLLTSQMMTPITKILNEQSNLLDNYNFLTPGFLPTPDSCNNSKSDVRKAATPSPSKKQAVKTSNSEQSISPVIECPIRIEEALAAEEEVVKPLQKAMASPKTPINKSPEVISKSAKKKPLKLGTKLNVHKSAKKKSIEELIITECLKNAEKDLFGNDDSHNKKSKTSSNTSKCLEKPVSKKQKPIKSGDDGKRKKEVPAPSKSDNSPLKSKSHVDIKLPTFEEMMTRLSKLNKLTSSSSSSDSSGDEVKKDFIKDYENSSKSSDSFPKLQVSPDESTTSLSGVNRLKILKPPSATINAKSNEKVLPKGVQTECIQKPHAPREVTAEPIKSTTKKSFTLKSGTQELIKDFSFLSPCGSSLKDLSFEYYDEGKGGDRNIKPTQIIQLFEFPLNKTKVQEKPCPKLSKMSSETSSRKSGTGRDSKIERKPENKELNKFKSLDKSSDTLDKKLGSSKRFVRSVRSKSREPRMMASVSKTSIRSHRSRLLERGMTPIGRRHRRRSRERYVDTPYRQYKRDRADEYRRKSSRGSKTRRSESPPNHSRSAKRNKENFSPNRSNSRDKHDSHQWKKSESDKKVQDKKHEERQVSEDLKARRLSSRGDKSKQDHHRELDPRTRSKINDHNYKEIKPVAESTPYNNKRERARLSHRCVISPREDNDSEKNDRFLKPSPEIRSPDSLNSDERRNQWSDPSRRRDLLRDTKGDLEKDEDSVLKISSQEDVIPLTDPRINKSSIIYNKISALPHHSSQPQDSPDSPPRDPRLLARTQRNLPNVSTTNAKRKLDEEREEGELSDDSSMSLQQITCNWKRRKLSDIPEADSH